MKNWECLRETAAGMLVNVCHTLLAPEGLTHVILFVLLQHWWKSWQSSDREAAALTIRSYYDTLKRTQLENSFARTQTFFSIFTFCWFGRWQDDLDPGGTGSYPLKAGRGTAFLTPGHVFEAHILKLRQWPRPAHKPNLCAYTQEKDPSGFVFSIPHTFFFGTKQRDSGCVLSECKKVKEPS